jgi:hypothetical protein
MELSSVTRMAENNPQQANGLQLAVGGRKVGQQLIGDVAPDRKSEAGLSSFVLWPRQTAWFRVTPKGRSFSAYRCYSCPGGRLVLTMAAGQAGGKDSDVRMRAEPMHV